GARGRLAAVLFDRLGLLIGFLGLDRQGDGTALAIEADEARLDLVADLEHAAGILDPVTRQLGSPQAALDAVAEIDDGALGVDLADDAPDHAALRVLRQVAGERILGELLHA